MKKTKYDTTNKYTGVDFKEDGVSKEDGYNCLSLAIDYCKKESNLDYNFEDDIIEGITWKNVVKQFNDNPKKIFNQLNNYFLNYYYKIPPHTMRKGDILIINGGEDGRKIPCIFVGNNKIILTTHKGVKVISLSNKIIYEVLRVKESEKIITKAAYNIESGKLLEENSYIYDGENAECEPATIALWVFRIFIVVMSYMMASSGSQRVPDLPDTGMMANLRSTTTPIRVIYGLQRVGGNDVYISTVGSKNKYLWIIQVLSEGECNGIHQETGVDQILVDNRIHTYYGAKYSYQFYSGSDTQTYDDALNAVDPTWESNLRYTSYMRWKFEWDIDKFMGLPARTVDLEGIKVHDFRTPANPNAWSQNAVLCLYDFMTHEEYGLDISSDKIDITSWTSAANYFDDKGWKFNYSTAADFSPWDVALDMMKHFRGQLTWFDGKYFLTFTDLNEESSVMIIEDKHIVQGGDGKAAVSISQPSRFNKPKGVKCEYYDKDKNYINDTVLVGNQTGLVENINMFGYTDRETVGVFATYRLERAQLNRIINGAFRDDCLNLAPNDLITFNSTALSIADQPMRVLSTSFASNGIINLILQYESIDLYNDTYDASIEGVYTCTLPDTNEVMIISNYQITEETFYYRLRTESRLNITFDVPEDEAWFDYCEVWQSIVSAGTPPPSASEYTHQFNTTGNFVLSDNIEQGKKYHIRLVTVSIHGTRQSFDDSVALVYTVQGNSSAPQSLSYLSAIPSNNSISLFSTKLPDPDIENYEFRIGMTDTGDSTWSTSLFLNAKRSPDVQLSQVKPGDFQFFCNTKGTNGLYGINPQETAAEVYLPIGWGLNNTFTDDYTVSAGASAGTFNNVEHTEYSSDDYLQCTHTSSLTGSYYSREFDTGVAAVDYYIYWDAWVYVVGAGSTWNDAVPSGNTWDSVNVSSLSWNEIFEVDAAPKVNITVLSKVTSGGEWAEMPNAEILSSIINARYFKVKIEIEDPTSEIYAKIQNFELNLYTKT